jgi:hypothetical protein
MPTRRTVRENAMAMKPSECWPPRLASTTCNLKPNNCHLSSSMHRRRSVRPMFLRVFQGDLLTRLMGDRLYQTGTFTTSLHHNTHVQLHSLNSLWPRRPACQLGHRRHKWATVVPRVSIKDTILNKLVAILHKVYHLLVWELRQGLLRSVDPLHYPRLSALHLDKEEDYHLDLGHHQVKVACQECLPGLGANRGHTLLGSNHMATVEADENFQADTDWIVIWGCNVEESAQISASSPGY